MLVPSFFKMLRLEIEVANTCLSGLFQPRVVRRTLVDETRPQEDLPHAKVI